MSTVTAPLFVNNDSDDSNKPTIKLLNGTLLTKEFLDSVSPTESPTKSISFSRVNLNNLFTAQSFTAKITSHYPNGKDHEFYFKSIRGSDNPGKNLTDLRRDLISNRNELRVYSHFSQDLRNLGVAIPRCYHTDSIGDVDDKELDDLSKIGVSFLFDCVDTNSFFQRSPLTYEETKLSVSLLADLHSATAGNEALLDRASSLLFEVGGYWEMGKRGAALSNLQTNWDNFREKFAHVDEWLSTPEAATLATKLHSAAQILSERLIATKDSKGACIIHGDAKALNMFLPNDNNKASNGMLIDFQWTGMGYGATDIAMHLAHCLRPECFENGDEEKLIDYYLLRLNKDRAITNKDEFMELYKISLCDFGRFVISVFYSDVSPEVFEKKSENENVCFANRNAPAAVSFVRRISRYLTELKLT